MNSRERVQKILRRELPDRLPFNFWMDRDLMVKLDGKFGENFRVTHYDVDVVETFFLANWFPELNRKTVADETAAWWLEPKIESIAKAAELILPDTQDHKIYTLIQEDRCKYPDKALFALLTTPLDVMFSLRAFEGMFLDFYDYPKETEEFLHRVGRTLAKMARNACSMDIDVLYVAGDICSAKGPFMSKDQLVRYCFEPLRGVVAEAKKAGIPVLFHTDGAVMDILDMFVEYGYDGINPLQPHLNDIRTFKEKYGNKLLLYGGLDNCYTIPDETPENVARHVRETFNILGRNGGYIASTHDIPNYVPLENIDILVKTIKECTYTSIEGGTK